MLQTNDELTQHATVGWFKAALLWLTVAVMFVDGCSTVSSPPSRPPQKGPQPSKPYQVYGQWYYPRAHAHGYTESGLASWYGKKFHGRKTSNGETYNMYGVSAAHKTLPFNTIVKVRNLDNGRELDLRINDRGPFVRGRIIDLSYGAAKELGVVGPGTARVELIALGPAGIQSGSGPSGQSQPPINYDAGQFTFQVGAFRDRNNAENLRAKLDRVYQNAHIAPFDTGGDVYYRVRVGFFTSLEEARKGEEVLLKDGYEPFVVAE